jgi:hypothetical protein
MRILLVDEENDQDGSAAPPEPEAKAAQTTQDSGRCADPSSRAYFQPSIRDFALAMNVDSAQSICRDDF